MMQTIAIVQYEGVAELQNLMDEWMVWSDATFGWKPPQAKLHHLKKEIVELIEALDSEESNSEHVREEFADCFALLLDAYTHAGGNAAQIVLDGKVKLQKNRGRKWSAPDENGVCLHVKTDDELLAEMDKKLKEYESEY